MDQRRVTDVETLKALGHPLRVALYRELSFARVATASQLGKQVGEPVSLVSYHLRKLAAHGLIEEAAEQGADGRERWWRPTSDGIALYDRDFSTDPDGAAAYTAVSRVMLGQMHDMHRQYLAERSSWSEEWRSASFGSEYLPRLTPEELRAFGEELRAVGRRWEERSRAADEAGETEGREQVAVALFGFPFRR
ncbi:MAG: helix-turn-helix transcriptional regulator [Nonomuraea sp.]|nr:helix-turn-helix transcriptional regulator [Nonomuraea sp.]